SGIFTNIVAKWPGSTHDSFIFTDSVIGQQLQTQARTLEDGLLLGDSGFPCRPFLMTPYLNPSSAQQEAFNRAHTKTRVAIEQTFGWWKRRFHLLHSEIRMTPEKACILIGACTTLHNIAILRNEPMDGLDDREDRPELTQYCGPEDGKAVRDYICDRFF
ncbi:putative nuclease HARBI1, partial [Montipora foliosa]|uniref:putative nuclease HARBI1 n=1 Tax=Montipora foliosa TaxID=591990 RepID=UPI0035F15A68